MTDMYTDTTTPATDRECVQIEGKARAGTVMQWPELVRIINRMRQAEARERVLREALMAAREELAKDLWDSDLLMQVIDAALGEKP